jgi:hypothetical protein
LLLLENSCFACPENEAHLLAVVVQTGVPPLLATTGLVSWLVQQLAQLARQALITGIKKVSMTWYFSLQERCPTPALPFNASALWLAF